MELFAALESILFVASKPLSFTALAKATGRAYADVEESIQTLETKYNHDASGIHLFVVEDRVHMGTNPTYADVVDQFISYDIGGELTKAQLETLTIISYRGPITRPELEQIRGVNCAVILRNLLMRDVIIELEDEEKLLPVYQLSTQALAHLGITGQEQLPEYNELHQHAHIEETLSDI
ncbi:SMC-Scp complex subunit ScpB [Patescibacteria group bacterium]|nr:SMC-Scp complex subunit ScpB [Patescibacteria group bacterium]MBU1721635.1 SMC-Scp complex subunit ScpB [Patescibacteria group bacterium]MBU1901703.1 SMC-Scp complex subunit ScpB [Patescibacteria group bacterium]